MISWCLVCGWYPWGIDPAESQLQHWKFDGCHEPEWSSFNLAFRNDALVQTALVRAGNDHYTWHTVISPGLTRIPHRLPDGTYIGNNALIDFTPLHQEDMP